MKMYTLICDGCEKDICDITDFSGLDNESLQIEASEQDWIEIDDKHYCNNCWEWDEEEENQIPKNQNK